MKETFSETISVCERHQHHYDFCPEVDWWKSGIPYAEAIERPAEPGPVSSLEREFRERAERWEKETAIHSSPAAKYLHKDYQFIMAKGERVIPLILKRLETSKKDWFWALQHIAGEEENPARDAKDFRAALQAWREWAKSKNFIS